MKKRYLIIAAMLTAIPAAAETATLTTKPATTKLAPARMTTEEFENWGAPASAKPSKIGKDLESMTDEKLEAIVAGAPKEAPSLPPIPEGFSLRVPEEEAKNIVWDDTPSWFGVPAKELLGWAVLVAGLGWLVWRGLRFYRESPQKLARGLKKGVVWSVLGLVGLVIVSNPNLVSSPVVAAVIVICYLQTRGATK